MLTSAKTSAEEQTLSSARTSWPSVLLAITAGALAAFQIGKVHIALPSVRQSFSLTLFSASWILSVLNVVGLFTATPVGSLSARIGNKRAVIGGLLFIAASSALGALSPSLPWLLLSRLMEGVGFILIVVAAPSLIVEVAGANDLRLALAGWSAYMPGGIALISLVAPFVLAHHTWRALWWLNSLLLAAVSVVAALCMKGKTGSFSRLQEIHPWEELTTVVAARSPVLLALIFGMYTMQHLSVMGFMPTLLHERFDLSEARRGILVSIAMASNILGNLAAGVLLQRGFSRTRMIAGTFLFMVLMTVAMFVLHLPLAGFYACTVAFSCVGGLIPSAIMGAAPFYTPSPTLLGATNGLLVQGSNLGLVLGPPVMSLIAIRLGWTWVPVMTTVTAALAAVLALKIEPTTLTQMELATPEQSLPTR